MKEDTTITSEIKRKVSDIDWEFNNTDTQYLTHNIHRYSGKFIPQIARTAIDLISSEGETILDPYMGSGTTLLEAFVTKRKGIGLDLNPLAVLISKVKTTTIPDEELDDLWDYVSARVLRVQGKQASLSFFESVNEIIPTNNDRLSNPWNIKWYQNHILKQLNDIYNIIETIADEPRRELAQIAFSNILRKCSNASSKYPNVMYDKNIKQKPLPSKIFLESLSGTIEKVRQLSHEISSATPPEIFLCSNLNMPCEDCTVDAIVTHPPYIASIPYAEYGCLSLNWLGHDSKQLDRTLTGGKRHSKDVIERFVKDYMNMFHESFRVLKPGKFAFYMVGNPTVNRKLIHLNEMTIEFGQNVGFEIAAVATRKGQNRRGNMMGEEYLIYMYKP